MAIRIIIDSTVDIPDKKPYLSSSTDKSTSKYMSFGLSIVKLSSIFCQTQKIEVQKIFKYLYTLVLYINSKRLSIRPLGFKHIFLQK